MLWQASVPHAFLQSQQDHSGTEGKACMPCTSMTAVPGHRAHYVFYFLIVVPDFQQRILCLSKMVIE